MHYIDYRMIMEKLGEERERTEQLNARFEEKIRDRERSYHKGSVEMDQQTYHDLHDRNEGNRRERKGVMVGLDWTS